MVKKSETKKATKVLKRKISVFYLVGSIVLWLLTISWMIMIFSLSSEPGDASSVRSLVYTNAINSLFGLSLSNELIRVYAHIGEYAFLSLITFLSLRFTNLISLNISYSEAPIKMIKSDNEVLILTTLWICALYAVTDEYHQIFVDGRYGSIIDAFYDLIGIFIVLIIIRLVYSISLSIKGKKEVRYE